MLVEKCKFEGLDLWVYNQTHLLVIIADSSLNITFLSKWFDDLLQLKSDKICGSGLFDIFPSLRENSVIKTIETALNGQVSVLSNHFHKYIIPIPLSKNDYPGIDYMQQSVTISPRLVGNKMDGVVIVIENVTDRVARELELSKQISELKLLHQSLEQSSRFNSDLLDTIPFGMDIIDGDGNILFLNKTMKSFLSSEPIGQKCWEVYRDNKEQCPECPLKKDIIMGKISISETIDIFAGKTFKVTHKGMIYNGKKAILEVFVDITESKQNQLKLEEYAKELQKSNAEKDKFFSIIAHDLRGPFSVLVGLTDAMLENFESFSKNEFYEIVENIKKTASNTYSLLNNLLEWSRLQRGMIIFNTVPVDVKQLVDDVTNEVSCMATEKSISLSWETPENFIITADNFMLESILRNMLTNAIKFTPSGGEVSCLVIREDEFQARFSIKDSGIGMKKELLDNLFRLDVNTGRHGTNNEPSAGLGLLLCKEFVEKHNGKITIDSVEGKGSIFSFLI